MLRSYFSVEEKLVIVAYAEKHGNTAAGRKFNLEESGPKFWRKQKSKLESLAAKRNKEKPNEETVLEKAIRRPQSKRRRVQSIDSKTKLEMIAFAKEHGVPAAALEFNVSQDTMRRNFRLQKSKMKPLLEQLANNKKKTTKSHESNETTKFKSKV